MDRTTPNGVYYMSLRLYQISAVYRSIAERVCESESGELTDGDLAELSAIEGALTDKTTNILGLIREWKTEEEAYRAEAARMEGLARRRAACAKRLSEYLATQLDIAGVDTVPTELGKVKVQDASRPAIRWDRDIEELPDELRRVTVALDGQAAYAAWKDGTLPDGFTVQRSRGIRVY